MILIGMKGEIANKRLARMAERGGARTLGATCQDSNPIPAVHELGGTGQATSCLSASVFSSIKWRK